MDRREFNRITARLAQNFGPTWFKDMGPLLWEDYQNLDEATFQKMAEHVRRTCEHPWPNSAVFFRAQEYVRGTVVEQTGRSNDGRQREDEARTREERERFDAAMKLFAGLSDDLRAPYLKKAVEEVEKIKHLGKPTPEQLDVLRRRWACLAFMRDKEVVR